MNVLSLFDGMSCGQIAFERAGIKVYNYYASEIEEVGIKVTQHNYPNTIQLGDVTKWMEWNIDWSSIDILIGGSPCQGFSFAGKQLNFDDERSKLFFEYVDIMNYIKQFNPNVKFLLENVKMKKEYQDVISEYVETQPIKINSDLVSAQNRDRLYWTNINDDIKQPEDKNIKLKDIINPEYKFKPFNPWVYAKWGDKMYLDMLRSVESEKSYCVTTNKSHQKNYYLNKEKTMIRMLERDEVEKLQTVPNGYTDIVSKTQAHKLLVNGWTVDVIAHIFSYLPEEYKIKSDICEIG